jgi:hypothetical protein
LPSNLLRPCVSHSARKSFMIRTPGASKSSRLSAFRHSGNHNYDDSGASRDGSARDRDQDKISVCSTSVFALVSRPTGPAAASASPPSVNLSASSFFMPLSFIISMKTSVDEPPIRKP